VFNGYAFFAGNEIFNSARTRAYVSNIRPNFGLVSRHADQNLQVILGDEEYDTPAMDQAPWYDASRPHSADFWGMYPLTVSGVEDGTREVQSTELIDDGSVSTLARYGSKEFRVTGLLVGDTEAGIDEGFQWLKGALAGMDCDSGDCTGDSFCYLGYLPDYCDYSDKTLFPDRPLDGPPAILDGKWEGYLQGQISDLPLGSSGIRISMPCGGDGAQRYITNLIPGQPYRLTLDLASSADLTVEIPGIVSLSATRENVRRGFIKSPWVLDFVAPHEKVSVRITAQGVDCLGVFANLRGTRVERTANLQTTALPRFATGYPLEPGSWEFSGTPAGIVTESRQDPDDTGIERMQFKWSNPTGSPITVTNGSKASRLVRGLIPGQEYTIFLKGSFSSGVAVGVSPAESNFVPPTNLEDGWYRRTFVASRPQEHITIMPAVDDSIPAAGELTFDLLYLRVDKKEPADLPIPDQAETALRTMYQVTLIDGPQMVEGYDKLVGAMRKVEFTFLANHPHIYGSPLDVPLDPSMTTSTVPNIECAYGEPVRVNLFTNPAFETAGTPPPGVTDSAFTTATQELVAVAGHSYSLGIASNGTGTQSVDGPTIDTSALIIGRTYSISYVLRLEEPQTGTIDPDARRIMIQNTGEKSEQAPNVAGDHRLALTWVHEDAENSIVLTHGADSTNAPVHVGTILLEESPVSGLWFSGDSEFGTWSGTANASESIWQKTGAILIVDPTAPVIPDAPQPPSLDPASLTPITAWRRYYIPIAANRSGGWLESYPIMKISTGVSTVRNVRVRFQPNPFKVRAEDLNPCDYCGEFFISYIPPYTTMTIDAILRKAVGDVGGSGEVSVMNLISNSDGGPAVWPALSCDIDYVAFIDVAPEEVLDLDVRMMLAQREG